MPERIAAGRFFEEIGSLPCIVGGVGEASGAAAGALFEPLGAPIVQTTPVEAELAKIWTNILRYAMFALPNRLMMECEQYDANVFEVIDLINRDYPRGGMPQPGFTAGTCLRKDFTFSEERSPAPGMLLAVSRVHESVPLFIVEGLKRRLGSLRGRKVAVLGLAFKADTDDERDSLSHKLIRLLERELADVAVHDPHVPTPTQSFDEAILDADAVVIATNHTRVPRPPGARRDRRQRQGRRGARRPVGLLRHQAGLQPAGRAGSRARPPDRSPNTALCGNPCVAPGESSRHAALGRSMTTIRREVAGLVVALVAACGALAAPAWGGTYTVTRAVIWRGALRRRAMPRGVAVDRVRPWTRC